MKCTNWVGTTAYGKKGKTRKISMRPEWVEQYRAQMNFIEPPKPCTGTVHMMIEPGEEPCMGGIDAIIKVIVHCSECGFITFEPKNFPTRFDLNDWLKALMDIVDHLDFEDGITRNDKLVEQRNARIKVLMEEKHMTDQQAYAHVLKQEESIRLTKLIKRS